MVDGDSVRSVGAGLVGSRELHHHLHVLRGAPETVLVESHRHPEAQVEAFADKHTHRVMVNGRNLRICGRGGGEYGCGREGRCRCR